ncbi:MAG TPA: AraC family transcriptional regulator ligand-binding domain-containing protein [Caulobacteraceae bacterium]|nr:AraC family transcriptional regulator ligand-binding domain-containing protein [Caulobacteraceae bacterium]
MDSRYFSALVGVEAAERLFRRAGLMTGDTPPPTMDLVAFWRLCVEDIQASNDESHGVAAEPVPLGSVSMLFTAAKEADDLLGALERFTVAARLIRRECRVSLGKNRETVRLTVRPIVRGSLKAEIYCECFLMVAHCAFRWMTGERLDPVLVRGAAEAKPLGGAIMEALRAPLVRRGEGATIVYSRRDMRAPILGQKYRVWGEAEFAAFMALLSESQTGDEVRAVPEAEAVLEAFRRGCRSQDQVARSLGFSTPTLRRRLAEAGLSFRRLSAEYRQAELQELLATGLPFHEIAERLGLSDDRSLRRFCADRLGVSPREYRLGAGSAVGTG